MEVVTQLVQLVVLPEQVLQRVLQGRHRRLVVSVKRPCEDGQDSRQLELVE